MSIEGKLQGSQADFTDYSVSAVFRLIIVVTDAAGKPVAKQERIGETRTGATSSGAFRLELPEGELAGLVTLRAHLPSGAVITVKEVSREQASKPIVIELPALTEPRQSANPRPDNARNLRLFGAVLDTTGGKGATDLILVIKARSAAESPEIAVAKTVTDSRGNFSAPYPQGAWIEAWGELPGNPPQRVSIPLDPAGTFPRRVLLSVSLPAPNTDNQKACGCHDSEAPPRHPDAEALAESAETYSADKGGRCVNFTVPNRTIEEYYYTFIVRTTDPWIKGLTMEEEEPPRYVPDDLLDAWPC